MQADSGTPHGPIGARVERTQILGQLRLCRLFYETRVSKKGGGNQVPEELVLHDTTQKSLQTRYFIRRCQPFIRRLVVTAG